MSHYCNIFVEALNLKSGLSTGETYELYNYSYAIYKTNLKIQTKSSLLVVIGRLYRIENPLPIGYYPKIFKKMIIAVKCPSCNANLQVPDDVEFVTCEYCDTSIKVREVVRIETDYDVPEWIKIADNAYKGENYDQAYDYYNMVLEKESFHANVWIGKGLSAGRLSEFDEPRFDEMFQLVTYGISISKKVNDDKQYAADEIRKILTEFFAKFRKDKFDYEGDFNDYIKYNKPFVHACERALKEFPMYDVDFKKFVCSVYVNLLQKNYEPGSEKQKLIEIKDPLKSEYLKKLKDIESDIKLFDLSYVSYEDAERNRKIKKLIVTGISICVTVFIAYFVINYFIDAAQKNKAKINKEDSSSVKQSASDYEVINKSVKNKKIIYTVFTETENLSDIQKYADALIERDKNQSDMITLYFLSDKNEANELGGKDIQLKNNNKNMPNSFSARVKYTKGKASKELSYYSKNKLTTETYQ
jgi:hypothetical protein